MSRKRARDAAASVGAAPDAETAGSDYDVSLSRCDWCLAPKDAASRRLYVAYHDEEWGAPVVDDTRLFELLSLEGAQAGLSWLTVLKKRDGYRRAFHGFDIQQVARMRADDVVRLLADPGIVRHRGKIEAVIGNAARAADVQREHGSLAAFLWSFVDGAPVQAHIRTMAELPTSTAQAAAMSSALRARGFKFVGPTICYAFMQAAGMVNDHLASCHRHRPVAELAATASIPRSGKAGAAAAE